MFTERHRYILKVLCHLAYQEDDAYETLSSLEETLDIPRGNLNQLVPELVELGYLESKKGRGGGIRLARPPEELEMRALIEDTRAMEHRSEETTASCCVPEEYEQCVVEVWVDKFKDTILADTTLADVRNQLARDPRA